MCRHVDQTQSVSTMLGVMSSLYDERPEDASLLVDLFARSCTEQGADDGCVLASLLNAQVFVSLSLLGEEGKEKVDFMTMWWAERCPN